MLDHKLKETSDLQILKDEYSSKPTIWKVEVSSAAKNCRNFIREIVDNLNLQPNPEKPVIALSIGDPTVYGNLQPSPETVSAVTRIAEEGTCNGYSPSVGYQEARAAVAEYLSVDGARFEPEDIVLASGCSAALEMCVTVLADAARGQNVLAPRPGFPLYRTLAEVIGVEVKFYDLLPENNWEVDLTHLESQIDQRTAAIILNNPSNPCGSVYDENHLRNILDIALRHRIPVIADEIYERLTWGRQFVSTAALKGAGVPVLVCGGLAKRYLVPGWRTGWVAVHDPIGAFGMVRAGLLKLSQRTLGSNTLVQGALPSILRNTPQSFHDDLINTLKRHAEIAFEGIQWAKGLTPYMPDGTMYMMIEVQLYKFPEFQDGLEFVKKMMEEESVFCLPGECFQMSGFMRIVLTIPEELLREACIRIGEFCNRHYMN